MPRDKIRLAEGVRAGLKAFQGDSNDNTERFLVLGYTDGVNTLDIIATGPGGVSELKQHLPPDKCRYGLVRRVHKVEISKTIKFAFVDWTPAGMKMMRKALLATHKGQVKQLCKPYHASVEAGSLDEVTEEDVSKSIGMSAGTAVNVVSRERMLQIETERKTKEKRKEDSKRPGRLVPQSVTKARSLVIEEEEKLREAIRAVRLDTDPTDWCVASYKNADTLVFIGSGSDGIEGLKNVLSDDNVFYALFRVTERIDKSVTVKFCFLKLVSDRLPPMRKSKITTHQGFVTTFFRPYHYDFLLSSKESFTEEGVMEHITQTSGSRSRVTDKPQTMGILREGGTAEEKIREERVKKQSSKKNVPSVSQSGGEKVCMEDEAALLDAIAEVRKDTVDTTWMCAMLTDAGALALRGKGTGGTADCMGSMTNANACFALLRVVDVIDRSSTTKFVYVKLVPAGLSPLKKGKLNTMTGVIDSVFRPYHVTFVVTDPGELTQEEVMDKVQQMSGSKSMVRARHD